MDARSIPLRRLQDWLLGSATLFILSFISCLLPLASLPPHVPTFVVTPAPRPRQSSTLTHRPYGSSKACPSYGTCKKKPVLHAEDEFELLKTLYTSTEMTFRHERYRVQLGGMMQLAGITGNRPGALLAVRYRHIKVTLLQDPNGGEQPRVLIEIIFPNTKGYLGEKDA